MTTDYYAELPCTLPTRIWAHHANPLPVGFLKGTRNGMLSTEIAPRLGPAWLLLHDERNVALLTRNEGIACRGRKKPRIGAFVRREEEGQAENRGDPPKTHVPRVPRMASPPL